MDLTHQECRHDQVNMEPESSTGAGKWLNIIIGILIMFGLYLSSLYHYLLFHTLVEMCIVMVFWTVFIVAWNCRRIINNNYLLFLGIAFLFVGGVELLHTLAYKGMGIFHQNEADLATQLWIAARYMESISLLMAPLFLGRRLKAELALTAYALVTILVLGAVFYWHVFPTCFVEGAGLTPFKRISEYVISMTLIGAIFTLFQKREAFDKQVFRWIVASIVMAIAAELAFTFYISVYGFSNLAGHFFKLIATYLIYKAVVETGLSKPYALLFRDLKQGQVALRKEKDFSESLVHTAPVIILVLNTEGRITYFNRYMEELCGYKFDEVVGKDWFSTFLPQQDHNHVRQVVREVLRGIHPSHIHPVVTKDGREIIVEWYDNILKDAQGQVLGLLFIGQDITSRVQAEEQIKSSLKEKEVLLREVHHRVKNNMQVIISLLKLQSSKIKDKAYADMFKECRERIGSMALIHEALYRTKDFANIGIGEYVKTLSNRLFQSYAINPGKIRLRINAEEISLGLDKAIPCGLILNELISNALKYAFPEDGEGEIRVSLRPIESDRIELIVSDSGTGIPEGMEMGKTESLGLSLVHLLAENQLEGEVELNRDAGTSFKIIFER